MRVSWRERGCLSLVAFFLAYPLLWGVVGSPKEGEAPSLLQVICYAPVAGIGFYGFLCLWRSTSFPDE